MASEWKTSLVREVARSVSETHTRDKEKLVFLNTSDVLNGKILHHEYTEVASWPGQAKKSIRRNDILFSEIRPANGRFAYVDIDPDDYVVSTKLMVIRSDRSLIEPRYLYHFLTQKKIMNWLQMLAESRSGTFPQITFDQVAELEIPSPPMEDQQVISGFADALEERITLLEEANATLESIAATIFRSWFVDFDPVRAKAEGREPGGMDADMAALFPDDFQESELGSVPATWRVLKMGTIAKLTIGGVWGSDTQESTDLVQAICLRGVDLENLRARGRAAAAPIRWIKPSAIEKRQLSDDEILIGGSGAGPVGRPLRAQHSFEQQYGMQVVYSNFVKRLKCIDEAHAVYLDRVLAEMHRTGEIKEFVNGTSVPNLDDKALLDTKTLCLPPPELLHKFLSIMKPISARLYDPTAATLAELRDTLLPRLISGKLRVPEAEKLIEAVL